MINVKRDYGAQRHAVRRARTMAKHGTRVPARPHQPKFGGMADEVEASCCAQPRVGANGQIISSILDQYQSHNWGCEWRSGSAQIWLRG